MIDQFGTASFPVTSPTYDTPDGIPVGSYLITAEVTFGAGYAAATTEPLRLVVAPKTPTVAITSSRNPGISGAPVTFEVSLSGIVTGASPQGQITLSNGTTALGTADVSWLGSSWGARITTSALTIGEHRIGASFVSSTGNYQHTVSDVFIQTMSGTPTETRVLDVVPFRPDAVGSWKFLVKNLMPTSPTPLPWPTGTVTVTVDGANHGTYQLSKFAGDGYSAVDVTARGCRPAITRSSSRISRPASSGPRP